MTKSTPPKLKTCRLDMRVDQDWLKMIDAYRQARRPVLSRSEAIRMLCILAAATKRDEAKRRKSRA